MPPLRNNRSELFARVSPMENAHGQLTSLYLLSSFFVSVPHGTGCLSLRLVSCLIRYNLIRAACPFEDFASSLNEPSHILQAFFRRHPLESPHQAFFFRPTLRLWLSKGTIEDGIAGHSRDPLILGFHQLAKSLDRTHRKRPGQADDLSIFGRMPFRVSALSGLPASIKKGLRQNFALPCN
jgi:hypothetical protein